MRGWQRARLGDEIGLGPRTQVKFWATRNDNDNKIIIRMMNLRCGRMHGRHGLSDNLWLCSSASTYPDLRTVTLMHISSRTQVKSGRYLTGLPPISNETLDY